MKLVDRLINFIFSLAILVLSVVILLVAFNVIDSEYINGIINDYVWNENNKLIVIVVSAVVLLAGLKTTIFLSDFRKKKKIPILVSSENGNIQIAGETIESTAKAVACSHDEVKDVNVKMVNKNKGVDIYMSILVVQDTNIRTLTCKIQEEVKEKIHETTGVLVLNTDIKVKNIVEKGKKSSVISNTGDAAMISGKIEQPIENKEIDAEENKVEVPVDEETQKVESTTEGQAD